MQKLDFGKPSVLVLVLASIIGRLIPHPANFTPLGGAALFGGAKLGRPWNYILPLFILFVTDLIIGFHGTMAYVYASFLMSVFLGEVFLKKRPALGRVGLVAILNAMLFFFVSNFGVWAEGLLYPRTIEGLLQCYLMALPFLTNTLLADLLFGVGFFALYAAAQNRGVTEQFDKHMNAWLGSK